MSSLALVHPHPQDPCLAILCPTVVPLMRPDADSHHGLACLELSPSATGTVSRASLSLALAKTKQTLQDQGFEKKTVFSFVES